MRTHVFVFVGTFATLEQARAYTEASWSPEPPDSVSDEEYAAWENDNPAWPLRAELGVAYLDADFIETVHGAPQMWSYLGELLADEAALRSAQGAAGDADTLVLVFEQALGGFEAALRSTARLTLCGRWPATL